MTLTIPEEVRAKAEIYVGDAAGQEKTRLLLEETGLPSGLLPLRDIIECGYVEETGFVWLKQRRKVDHYFAKAGRHVSYAAEVSAVAEQGRLRKITGVKAKEMLIWVTLHEICLDDVNSSNSNAGGGNGKLVCKAIGGLSRSFPVEAFEAEGVPPTAVKPTTAAAGGGVVGGKLKPPAAAAAEKKEEEEVGKKKEEVKEEQKPGQEEQEEEGDRAKEEGDGKSKEDAAAVDGVEEKLKELTTETPVHAEAVSAKN